jgi:heme/copper-type cytochrome/quinol oxidase subunit 2
VRSRTSSTQRSPASSPSPSLRGAVAGTTELMSNQVREQRQAVTRAERSKSRLPYLWIVIPSVIVAVFAIAFVLKLVLS